MDIVTSRRWYENGLGLRSRAGRAYHLLRFLPGDEGDRAFVAWNTARRATQEARTKLAFDAVVAGLNAHSIVIDLGANVGDVTAMLAQTGALVHSFEPEPTLFAHLTKRFAMTPNVKLHQAAIAAHAGKVNLLLESGFDKDPKACQSHSIVAGSWNADGQSSVEVNCVNFFEFINGLGRKPDLIKMDIEGAEVEILERMLSENRFDDVAALFVETHERQNPSLHKRIRAIHRGIRKKNVSNVNLLWI